MIRILQPFPHSPPALPVSRLAAAIGDGVHHDHVIVDKEREKVGKHPEIYPTGLYGRMRKFRGFAKITGMTLSISAW